MPSTDLNKVPSKDGSPVLCLPRDLPDYPGPSVVTSSTLPKMIPASTPAETGQPGTPTGMAGEKTKAVIGYGPLGLTLSMQVKMNEMGRDLDALHDTIHYMQGVQDAQDTTIGRLLACQRRF
ncbi:uncharacterized protein FPOAC1_013872 [Fusarium poae]|uniref:uncharacterized protein n=1 Tax=Fusarium poae TaxID=36050 RepID=UPI001D03D928|nr:uncharacterized protein FPOAC1_013833 [Fusarium poae]XP_044701036.1 uncharacterized protein FPOAC1_013872 [Fusarium poae]KAG8664494.1 hypothetical protein FPOAC1_013833 [Fusarium poae]KAG8664533.1 hypothetical protein FPOAC1_013872 [Fusarium poae]